MVKRLNSFLKNKNLKINYVDVGARDDISNLLNKIQDNLNVYGFETDPDENELLKKKFPNRKYYKYGLWSTKKTLELFVTKDPSSSSLYKPNISENNNYKDIYHDNRKIIKKLKIKVLKMDDLIEISPDFIKIDTQGSEYDIIKGATEILLNNCPLISLETWTRDVYKGSPTFEKIIPILTNLGYEILDMELCAAEKHKTKHAVQSKQTVSGYEIVFGRKNLEMIGDNDTKLKYILLLDLFGYRDLALFLNETYLNDSDLESYILNNGKLVNNLSVLIKKSFRIFHQRIIGEPFFKISD
jgi:FkbM family methyltransferase